MVETFDVEFADVLLDPSMVMFEEPEWPVVVMLELEFVPSVVVHELDELFVGDCACCGVLVQPASTTARAVTESKSVALVVIGWGFTPG